MNLALSPQERSALTSLEARLSQRAHFPITVERLFTTWRDFVDEVETGYEDSIDEYTNDLSARDIIDEVLASAPEHLRVKLLAVLSALDEKFQQASRVDEDHVLRRFTTPRPGWWWSRLPLKLVGPLRSSLKPG